MRVVTTCNKEGLKKYGHRWLESRKNWPAGTDFQFYTEGFTVDCPGKDVAELREFQDWRARHVHYIPPSWRWDIVRFAFKTFAAWDALEHYDGVGVWLDADCVTFKPIPDGLIESQVGNGVYLAHYGRTGHYTETGLWVMDCSHAEHRNFIAAWRKWYLTDAFVRLIEWHDCTTLDATIRRFEGKIKTKNLSGAHHMEMHPQALSELGQYVDHCKGQRKSKGFSAENQHHRAAA